MSQILCYLSLTEVNTSRKSGQSDLIKAQAGKAELSISYPSVSTRFQADKLPERQTATYIKIRANTVLLYNPEGHDASEFLPLNGDNAKLFKETSRNSSALNRRLAYLVENQMHVYH